MRTKAVLFSEFGMEGGGCFIVKKNWEGIQIYLSGKGFMYVWKGGG